MKRGYKQLLEEANRQIVTWPVKEARSMLEDSDTVFVDIRDVRELQRDGMIPGAIHAPRGMLEFWVDPESPYHKPVFASGKRFVFYCGSGWRSALATATLQDMGLEPIGHLEGGVRLGRTPAVLSSRARTERKNAMKRRTLRENRADFLNVETVVEHQARAAT